MLLYRLNTDFVTCHAVYSVIGLNAVLDILIGRVCLAHPFPVFLVYKETVIKSLICNTP